MPELFSTESRRWPEKTAERYLNLRCSIDGFPDRSAPDANRQPAWFGLLEALPMGAAFVTEITPTPANVAAHLSLSSAGIEEGDALAVLQLAAPGARLMPCKEAAGAVVDWTAIRPAAFDLLRKTRPTVGPQLRTGPARSSACLVSAPPASRIDWEWLITLVRGFEMRLQLRLSVVELNASAIRTIDRMREALHAVVFELNQPDTEIEGLQQHLRELASTGRAAKIEVFVGSSGQIGTVPADLVSCAVFGKPADQADGDDQVPDLRGLWVHGDRLPSAVPNLRAARLAQQWQTAPVTQLTDGALVLGESDSGTPLILSGRDRDRHVYVIGATGTGKSTCLLNLIAQDARNGEGIILLDPHGDLADDALDIVTRCNRRDVIFADASDASGNYRINLLEGIGASAAAMQNFVVNGLIRLLRRVLYDGVPEAFGPMFELYFRNALLLLMSSGGSKATLMDFESVFADKEFRHELLKACEDPKIVQFWREIAEKVTHQEASLRNLTPYITCKLAQFTGNPVLRELLCPVGRTLDVAKVMDEGGVLILKASKGILGQTDTEILAAVTLMRIAQAGMARAAIPRALRRPVRLYVDEFQTCAGDGLADVLAEARKFGISLVLANQSLRQVDGRGTRPDVGEAALANAANLIALRVGAPDAARLAPWFERDAENLC